MQEATTDRTNSFRLPLRQREIAALIGLMLLAGLAVWMLMGQLRSSAPPVAGEHESGISQTAFEEQTGIRIIRIALTGGGGLIDIRYMVVNPDKWLQVHDDFVPPKLIIQETGDVIGIRFHEHSHSSFSTARIYSDMLVNSDGLLEKGMHVTLRIREFELENIPVQ